MNMKLGHVLIIKEAISQWLKTKEAVGKGTGIKQIKTIVCSATYFNWEVFYAAKVQGDSLKFMANELYPYLTSYDINDALMRITQVDGSGIRGSGVKRGSV